MGFWEKSVRIFNYLCEAGTQSVRHIAQHTGVSKSSAHRLKQAMVHRDIHPESWLWETAEGRRWLTRLVVATLYTFGLKRGVGLDTISEFFSHLHLEMQMGSSPGALRGVMQALERAVEETGHAWEQAAIAAGEAPEIIGAVDETFLERLLLVFLDLPTGYLLLEEAVEDRSYATWKALVDKRLEALRAPVRYLVSDRAKALIKLAEQGLECLSIPDVFHLMHDMVKSYALAIGRQVRQARQEWQKAQDGLQRHQEREPQSPVASLAATRQVETAQAEVRRWETVQSEYRQRLETLSLTLHPFCIDDSTPQTSAQVESRVRTQIEAIEALAHTQQLPPRQAAMKKVKKQVPDLAALVDFWWAGVRQDLDHAGVSPLWQTWAQEALLPQVYWGYQVTRTRCTRRKAKIQQALESVRAACATHRLTQCLPLQALGEWHAWATRQVQAFQRASSAVEGRNGSLAQLHHNQRGLPKHRYKIWAVLHNFDCRAADGTTPASRFFRQTFPDLFETVLAHIQDLPLPRQRQHELALKH
jgi:Family of unknown function (DUF6399)/IclR helix-turn-helix domain